MAVPTIQSVYLNGASLKVTWAVVQDTAITQYVVTVFYGVNTVFTTAMFPPGTPPYQSGNVPLPGGVLDTNTSYFVQVSTMWGNSPGQNETSQLVPLITRLPVLQAGYFDGTNFYLEWEPSTQASQGYYFQIYAANAGASVSGSAPTASDWWGVIPGFTQGSGLQWMLQVAAAGTVGSDDGDRVYAGLPATPLPAVFPSLSGFSATYQSGAQGVRVGAQWTALSASSGMTRYRLQVFAPDGTPGASVDVPGVASTSALLALPGEPAAGSTLRLLALNDAGVGVSTAASALLTSVPTLTAAAFTASNADVNVAWSVNPSAAVTGYLVEIVNLANPSQSYPQAVSGGASRSCVFNSLPQHGLDTTQPWGVRVSATGAAGSVPAVSSTLPLPAVAPAITALVSQGGELDVAWSLASTGPAPAAFVLNLMAGATLAASVQVQGAQATQARLRVPDASQTYTVTVAALAMGGGQGPFSAAATPLVAPVTGVQAVTDALTGLCTLSWSGATNATGYQLAFSDGSATTVSSASYAFTYPLPPDAELSVSISPTAGTAQQAITGPASPPHPLPTGRATVQTAGFNAAAMSATASWAAVPGASAYRLALMASTGGVLTELAHALAPAGSTQAGVAFPASYALSAGTQYLVLVQAQWGNDRGLQGNQLPIFATGYYLSTSAATTAPPFVYPATLITTTTAPNGAMTGEPLTLYLPDVGAGSPLAGLPLTQGAFTLAANGDATKNNRAYPYVLSISNTAASNNPWTFAPSQSIRTGLASDVQTFLKNAEAAGAVPWGITLMQQVLARMLPQTFAEQLYYNFGLRFPGAGVSQGSVDLRPGMVLRVHPNPYQTVAGQSSWLSGYMAAACIDYDVGSLQSASGAWSAGFDSFIGQLVGGGALNVVAPSANASTGDEQGIAEAADLYFPTFAQSFYRLFVPTNLLSPTGVNSQYQLAANNFVLAAASNYAGLLSSTSAPATNNPSVVYFRGRTVLKACLRVSLNGASLVVPVGTTLANVLEQQGCLSPVVPGPLLGVSLERGLGGAVLNPNAPATASSVAVHLDAIAANAAIYGPGWGLASLPLLPGDRISLG